MLTKSYTKFYELDGITINVTSDLPILENTFHPKFKLFETSKKGYDNIYIHHHFEPPRSFNRNSALKIYDQEPWTIYKLAENWIYERIHKFPGKDEHYCTAFFNPAHTHVEIYNRKISEAFYRRGFMESLTLFPTDQIILAKIFAERSGCFFHSNAVILKQKGFLFMGHSGAGKSTISKMLNKRGGNLICDDRILAKKENDTIRIFGSWCHGKENIYSAKISSLNAIFFINKSKNNQIIPISSQKEKVFRLISFIIKPLVTKDWWENNFKLIDYIAKNTPCFILNFDKSGKILDLLEKI